MSTLQEKVQCWFQYVATKPGVIENRSCEGTDCLKAALSSGVTRSGYGCLSKKFEQGEHEAVTLLFLVPWPSWPTYRVKTQDSKHYVSYH